MYMRRSQVTSVFSRLFHPAMRPQQGFGAREAVGPDIAQGSKTSLIASVDIRSTLQKQFDDLFLAPQCSGCQGRCAIRPRLVDGRPGIEQHRHDALMPSHRRPVQRRIAQFAGGIEIGPVLDQCFGRRGQAEPGGPV